MSYLCLCDVCEQIIKDGEDKFILIINKAQQRKPEIKVMNYEEFMQKVQRSKAEPRIYEICNKCKILMDRFLAMRRKDLKKLEKELTFLEGKENNEKI